MGFAGFYFQKFCKAERKIKEPASGNLSLIITIPCFKENNIIKALESLYFCAPTQGLTEVIVLINYPQHKEDEYGEFHKTQFEEIRKWAADHSNTKIKFHPILEALPEKDAGVGLARKIAMDEAVRRFQDIENPRGIIAGYDGDCNCSPNYLTSLEACFLNPKVNACSVHFEHPTEGVSYDSATYEAILHYELYLRYYVEALRFSGFPYSYHTLGSSFAVTAETYIRQGGMNKRKAGEDFYFLHKVIPAGGFVELNKCSVFPSPRVSDRVPFGTGAAVNKILQQDRFDFQTFCPESFHVLKEFFLKVPSFYKMPEKELLPIQQSQHISLNNFLEKEDFTKNLSEINSRCSHFQAFEKAFYNWFNGLMVLQFLNFAHESHFEKIPVSKAAAVILQEENRLNFSDEEADVLLKKYREIQNPERKNFTRPQQ